MAQDTVQAVRQAELNAAQKEKEAVQKAESILSEAHREARLFVESKVKEALQMSEVKRKEAEKKSADLLEAAKVKADQEVFLLKEMVHGKEQAAIDYIISSLI